MGFKVIQGEAVETMRGMPDASVDLVLTDPPYFLPAAHYNVRSGSFKSLSDLSILEHFFRDVFAEAARVLKPTGFLYAFCDGQSYPAFYATAYKHFRRLRPLIWDKQNSINGYAWRHQHELILFAEKENAPRVPTGDGDVLRCRAVPIKERDHLAEKPVELVARLLKKVAGPDAVVFDPFCGSGTTGVAAVAEGFNFIGVEREAEYAATARRRIDEALNERPLFAEAIA